MRRLWTEPVVDFKGKFVTFETMRLDPKPVQKPHVPIIVGGYAEAAFRRAVQFGAGWYGFNLDPARTKDMLAKLDAAFAKAGKKRDKGYEIIITPPMATPPDAMQAYAELGVHRVVVNLGGQKPEQVAQRLPEMGALVKKAALGDSHEQEQPHAEVAAERPSRSMGCHTTSVAPTGRRLASPDLRRPFGPPQGEVYP